MILTKFICMQKDLSEPKYEYLIRNCENVGINHLNDSNVQIPWMMFMRILMIITQAEKEKF